MFVFCEILELVLNLVIELCYLVCCCVWLVKIIVLEDFWIFRIVCMVFWWILWNCWDFWRCGDGVWVDFLLWWFVFYLKIWFLWWMDGYLGVNILISILFFIVLFVFLSFYFCDWYLVIYLVGKLCLWNIFIRIYLRCFLCFGYGMCFWKCLMLVEC